MTTQSKPSFHIHHLKGTARVNKNMAEIYPVGCDLHEYHTKIVFYADVVAEALRREFEDNGLDRPVDINEINAIGMRYDHLKPASLQK